MNKRRPGNTNLPRCLRAVFASGHPELLRQRSQLLLGEQLLGWHVEILEKNYLGNYFILVWCSLSDYIQAL